MHFADAYRLAMGKLNRRTKHLLKSIDKDIHAKRNADGPFSPEEAIRYLDSIALVNKSFKFWHNRKDEVYNTF